MATCKVCTDGRRSEVEGGLVAGSSIRELAARFGLAPTTLHRHRGHMEIAEPVEPRKEERGEVVRKAGCCVCGGSSWWPRPGKRWLCATCFPSGEA